MMPSEIPRVENDATFIAIVYHDGLGRSARMETLRERYGAQGHASLGGNVRPMLGLCNVTRNEMFDGRDPRVGDVVILGHVAGLDSCEVVVGRLAERYATVAEMPEPDLPGYLFEWRADRIAIHSFAPEKGGKDYRDDRNEPGGEVGVDFIRYGRTSDQANVRT